MLGLNQVRFRTLQCWHGASARHHNVFYHIHVAMVKYEVMKIGSRCLYRFDNIAIQTLFYNVIKHRTFSRILSHIIIIIIIIIIIMKQYNGYKQSTNEYMYTCKCTKLETQQHNKLHYTKQEAA